MNEHLSFPKRTLILMQGVPGSGKSTVAESILRDLRSMYDPEDGLRLFQKISTDDYWYEKGGGVYAFDHGLLGLAHFWNQERCQAAMAEDNAWVIIVDNTNRTCESVKPYVELAKTFGYTIQTIRVDPGLDVALERNARRSEDRRVPDDVIRAMYAEMEPLL